MPAKNAISHVDQQSELGGRQQLSSASGRSRPAWRRCDACEQRQQQGTPKPQPVEQEAEVVADGGEHGVVGVAFREGQIVAAHTAVLIRVADDGFNGGPPAQRELDALGETALVAGDMDLEGPVLGRIVAAVAGVEDGTTKLA